MEGGQGIDGGLATLVAEEMDADWSQMHVEGGAGNIGLYGNLAMGGAFQLTGGSTAMVSSWQRYRQAGAVARALLVAAAADAWQVRAAEIGISGGRLMHPSGKSGYFGEFVEAASAMTPPENVTLKTPAEWRYIGKEALRRPDTAPKTRGEQDYTIDVSLPCMLTAVLKRPPRFGGKVASFDAEPVRKMPGVVDVVATPRGVAVVAKSYWEALKGRDALEVDWDDSGARFEFPYLAHAALEPLNAVARFENGRLEIWAGHQMPDYYQGIAAEIMGLRQDQVELHVMMTGGFFGRRATPDADVIVEAVSIVKAMGEGVPVRVQWTREDEMQGGR